MTSRADEFEAFKQDINLIDYAWTHGYEVDRRESTRSAKILRGPANDKLQVIRRLENGHWVYFSFRDVEDNGSIIDFIQRRTGASFGAIRMELRPWVGGHPRPTVRRARPYRPQGIQPVPLAKDREAVLLAWNRTTMPATHPYLAYRGLPAEMAADPLFAGHIREDERGNLIFEHRDGDGVCGFERKSRGFTGFSEGGSKGLWRSNIPEAAKELAVGEAVLDLLSYHVLHPPQVPRWYIATSGGWSPATAELLRQALASLPADGQVLILFDADHQGRAYAQEAGLMCQEIGRACTVQWPSAKDWNEVLMAERGLSR